MAESVLAPPLIPECETNGAVTPATGFARGMFGVRQSLKGWVWLGKELFLSLHKIICKISLLGLFKILYYGIQAR